MIYAVHFLEGEQAIYETWDECAKAKDGVSGAISKKCYTLAEAGAWLLRIARFMIPDEAPRISLYVDGSNSSGKGPTIGGWAFVAVAPDGETMLAQGDGFFPAKSNNIDGELRAAKKALLWAPAHRPVEVVCDYLGIAFFALGTWTAKSHVAIEYRDWIAGVLEERDIKFRHVKGHSGDKWNNMADSLAGKAVKRGKKEEL